MRRIGNYLENDSRQWIEAAVRDWRLNFGLVSS